MSARPEWLSWDILDTIWLYKMVRYVDYLVHAWLLGWVSEGGHSGLILVIDSLTILMMTTNKQTP